MPTSARCEIRRTACCRFQACSHFSHEQPGPSGSAGELRDPPSSWNSVAMTVAGRRDDIVASALLGDKLNGAPGDFLLLAINSCLPVSSDCRCHPPAAIESLPLASTVFGCCYSHD